MFPSKENCRAIINSNKYCVLKDRRTDIKDQCRHALPAPSLSVPWFSFLVYTCLASSFRGATTSRHLKPSLDSSMTLALGLYSFLLSSL